MEIKIHTFKVGFISEMRSAAYFGLRMVIISIELYVHFYVGVGDLEGVGIKGKLKVGFYP